MEITVNDTLKRVQFLTRRFDRDDIDSAILAILIDLRVCTSHIGFEYLRAAIKMNYQYPAGTMTNDVYPCIADCFETDGVKPVERAIHNTIISAWRERDDRIWGYYFMPDREGKIKKPTNAQFVTKLARLLELSHSCVEEVTYERE